MVKMVILNLIGVECVRFKVFEIKEEVKFKILNDFEFDMELDFYFVVKFVVEKDLISFYYVLYYILLWFIECV